MSTPPVTTRPAATAGGVQRLSRRASRSSRAVGPNPQRATELIKATARPDYDDAGPRARYCPDDEIAPAHVDHMRPLRAPGGRVHSYAACGSAPRALSPRLGTEHRGRDL